MRTFVHKSNQRQESVQNKLKRHILTEYLLLHTKIKLEPVQNYATKEKC